MSGSPAVLSAGTKLQRGDGATPTEVFADVAEVLSIGGPNEEAPSVETTPVSATSRTSIPGLKDGGEIPIELNFVGDDASQALLRSDFAAGKVSNYKIVLPDATATKPVPSFYAFAAGITKWGTSFEVNSQIKLSISLKISGPVTFTPRAA